MKRILVIVSNSSADRKQIADQQRALVILKSIGIIPEEFPGDDPGQEEKRDRLLAISGLKGNYPQIFAVDDDDESATKFVGNYDDIQTLADDKELTREALGLPSETENDDHNNQKRGSVFIGATIEKQGEEANALDMDKVQEQLKGSELGPKDEVQAAEPGTVPAEVERLEGSEPATPAPATGEANPLDMEKVQEQMKSKELDPKEDVKAAEPGTVPAEVERLEGKGQYDDAPDDEAAADAGRTAHSVEEVASDDDFVEEEVVTTDDEFEEVDVSDAEDSESRSIEVASQSAEEDNDEGDSSEAESHSEGSRHSQSSGRQSSGSETSGSQSFRQEPDDPFAVVSDEPFVASKEDLFPEDPFQPQSPDKKEPEAMNSRATPAAPSPKKEERGVASRAAPVTHIRRSASSGSIDIEAQRTERIRRRKERAARTAKSDWNFHLMVGCLVLLIAGGGAAVVVVFYEP